MSNIRLLSFLALLPIISAYSTPARAGCSGNACDDLFISQRNNCIVLTNRNSRQNIEVIPVNAAPTPVYLVYSNSELIPTLFGNCHRDWYTNHTANFKN